MKLSDLFKSTKDRKAHMKIDMHNDRMDIDVSGSKEEITVMLAIAMSKSPKLFELLATSIALVHHKVTCDCESCREFQSEHPELVKEVEEFKNE